jgi:Family of unknown function (DUF6790)
MWQLILAALMVAGAVHAQLTRRRAAELMLIYVLAGYCGVLMFAVGLVAIINPDWVAINMAQVPPGNPVMIWAGFFFLGLSVVAMMTIWFRGAFLAAPVIAWSVYWAGATYAHLVADQQNGHAVTPGLFFATFVGHGLVALILLGLAGMLWLQSAPTRRPVAA